MALPSSQRFTNAIVGNMQTGADTDLYAVNTSCKYVIGQGFTRGDGNKYRYASFDTTVAASRLVAPVFANSGKATTDNIVVNPASVVQVPSEYPILPGQVASHYVEITLGGIAANQYQGGYLVTEDGSGKNYIYRIKGNTATGNPAAGNFRMQLAEPLQALVSGTTDITIVPSMYNDCDVASAATNWAVSGVTMAAMTAGTFGWVCTHGVCAVLQDGAWTGGDQLALSSAVSGSVAAYGAGTSSVAALTGVQIVGYAIQNGGDTEIGTMYLQIE